MVFGGSFCMHGVEGRKGLYPRRETEEPSGDRVVVAEPVCKSRTGQLSSFRLFYCALLSLVDLQEIARQDDRPDLSHLEFPPSKSKETHRSPG